MEMYQKLTEPPPLIPEEAKRGRRGRKKK